MPAVCQPTIYGLWTLLTCNVKNPCFYCVHMCYKPAGYFNDTLPAVVWPACNLDIDPSGHVSAGYVIFVDPADL